MDKDWFSKTEDHWLIKRTLIIGGKVEPEVLFVPICEAALVFFWGTPAHVIEPVDGVMPQVMIAPLVGVPIRFRISEDAGYFAIQCRATVLSRVTKVDFTPRSQLGIPFINRQTKALCHDLPGMEPEQKRASVLRYIESLIPGKYVPDNIDLAYEQIVGGKLPLKSILRNSGMSERTVQRQFLRRTGISPKRLSRIARINRLWRESQEKGGLEFQKTHESGSYFDQSHMIHDFNSLTGAPPMRFFYTCTATTAELANKR